MPKRNFITLPKGRPRARSSLEYDYYDFLTRPELRPKDPSFEKTLYQTIEKTRNLIEPLSVLKRLNDARQQELAALVCDYIAKHEDYASLQKGVAKLREASRLLGQRRLRRIRKAVQVLRPAAEGLPDEHPFAAGGGLKRLIAGIERVPEQWPAPTAGELEALIGSIQESHPQPKDPAPEATWQLFWFFVEECGLPKKEAEVRLAKIGKNIFGWKKVRYRSRYKGADFWKGSTTIRQRIARYKGTFGRRQDD